MQMILKINFQIRVQPVRPEQFYMEEDEQDIICPTSDGR